MIEKTPGELWRELRKGSSPIYVEWRSAHGTVIATDLRMRTGPPVTIALSLEKSLRTRSKDSGTYVDAHALAEGGLRNLHLVEISDEYVVSGLCKHLEYTENLTLPWRLLVELRGEHEFRVEPEFRAVGTREELLLRVLNEEDG